MELAFLHFLLFLNLSVHLFFYAYIYLLAYYIENDRQEFNGYILIQLFFLVKEISQL